MSRLSTTFTALDGLPIKRRGIENETSEQWATYHSYLPSSGTCYLPQTASFMPDKGVGMTPEAVDIESFLRYDPHRPRNVLLNADGTPYVSPDLSSQLPDLPDCQTLIDVSREKIRRQDMPSVATSYRFDIQGPSRASPAALFGRDTRQEIKDAYKVTRSTSTK